MNKTSCPLGGLGRVTVPASFLASAGATRWRLLATPKYGYGGKQVGFVELMAAAPADENNINSPRISKFGPHRLKRDPLSECMTPIAGASSENNHAKTTRTPPWRLLATGHGPLGGAHRLHRPVLSRGANACDESGFTRGSTVLNLGGNA